MIKLIPLVRPLLSIFASAIFLSFFSCVPRQAVQFRAIRNIVVDMDQKGAPLIKGEAVFFNPNKVRMKLKEIRIDVAVEGKKAAVVDQKPALMIPAAGEFSVFVEAVLDLKEIGLMDTLLSLFGGKKYNMQYTGYVRVRVHGVTVKVPIKYEDQVRLKM